jgi:hypothetical protein
MKDVKRMVDEGAAVMSELEKMTRKIVNSAREKAVEAIETKPEEPREEE